MDPQQQQHIRQVLAPSFSEFKLAQKEAAPVQQAKTSSLTPTITASTMQALKHSLDDPHQLQRSGRPSEHIEHIVFEMNEEKKNIFREHLAEGLKIPRRKSLPFSKPHPLIRAKSSSHNLLDHIDLNKTISIHSALSTPRRPSAPKVEKLQSLRKVFLNYAKRGMPPGQLFSDIAKKTRSMDLRHFNNFLEDFGLLPGVFSSREEVEILFHRLNLMSKRNESRMELSMGQFDVFIQGVLKQKMPKHHRDMSSEQALHNWRQRKISGDHSNWKGLQTLGDKSAQYHMETIEEDGTPTESCSDTDNNLSLSSRRTSSIHLDSTDEALGIDIVENINQDEVELEKMINERRRSSFSSVAAIFQQYENDDGVVDEEQFRKLIVDYGVYPNICSSEKELRSVLRRANLPGGGNDNIVLTLPQFADFIESVLQDTTDTSALLPGDECTRFRQAFKARGDNDDVKSVELECPLQTNQVPLARNKIEVLKHELDERLHSIFSLKALASTIVQVEHIDDELNSNDQISINDSTLSSSRIVEATDIVDLEKDLGNEGQSFKQSIETVRLALQQSSLSEQSAQSETNQIRVELEKLKKLMEVEKKDRAISEKCTERIRCEAFSATAKLLNFERWTKSLCDQLNSAEKEISILQIQRKTFKSEIQSISSLLNSKSDLVHELVCKLNSKIKELDDLRCEIDEQTLHFKDSLHSHVSVLGANMNEVKEQIQLNDGEKQSLQAIIRKSQLECDEMKNLLSQFSEEKQCLLESKQQLEHRVDANFTDYEILQNELRESNLRVGEVEQIIVAVRHEAQSSIKTLKTEYEDCCASLKVACDQREQLNAINIRLQAQLDQAYGEIKELSSVHEKVLQQRQHILEQKAREAKMTTALIEQRAERDNEIVSTALVHEKLLQRFAGKMHEQYNALRDSYAHNRELHEQVCDLDHELFTSTVEKQNLREQSILEAENLNKKWLQNVATENHNDDMQQKCKEKIDLLGVTMSSEIAAREAQEVINQNLLEENKLQLHAQNERVNCLRTQIQNERLSLTKTEASLKETREQVLKETAGKLSNAFELSLLRETVALQKSQWDEQMRHAENNVTKTCRLLKEEQKALEAKQATILELTDRMNSSKRELESCKLQCESHRAELVRAENECCRLAIVEMNMKTKLQKVSEQRERTRRSLVDVGSLLDASLAELSETDNNDIVTAR